MQYARKGGRGSQQKYLHAVKKQMEMSEAWIDLNMHPIDVCSFLLIKFFFSLLIFPFSQCM